MLALCSYAEYSHLLFIKRCRESEGFLVKTLLQLNSLQPMEDFNVWISLSICNEIIKLHAAILDTHVWLLYQCSCVPCRCILFLLSLLDHLALLLIHCVAVVVTPLLTTYMLYNLYHHQLHSIRII